MGDEVKVLGGYITPRDSAPQSVLNKKTFAIKPMYYLLILYLSKPTTNYNREIIKPDRDFSNAVTLVLLTLKLIHHMAFFDAQKGGKIPAFQLVTEDPILNLCLRIRV